MVESKLVINNLSCARNNQILFAPVNLTLKGGQILHLCGENGLGKTSLLRCITGLSKPFSGAVTWNGQSILTNQDFQKQLFFLGHKNATKSSLSSMENLQYCASQSSPLSLSNINHALVEAHLYSKANCLVSELSAGQRQRLAWARLMLSEATVWILDEPFTALDQEGISWGEGIMRRNLAKGGLIIFTSHHPPKSQFSGFGTYSLTRWTH